MSKNPDEQPDAIFLPLGQTHTEEGTMTHGTAWRRDGVSIDDAREVIAENHGLEPDEVVMGDEISPEHRAAGEAIRRTMSVGFSSDRWHSSWDPDQERAEREAREQAGEQPSGDPNMN